MNTKRRFVLASLVLAVLTAGLQAQEATRLGDAPSDTRTSVPQAKLLSNIVTGTGTAGKIPKWTGSGTLGNSMLTESGGKIGVGTSTPSAKLDVAGGVAVNGSVVINGSGKWVGDPTGLVGPVGPAGPAGVVSDAANNTWGGDNALASKTTGFPVTVEQREQGIQNLGLARLVAPPASGCPLAHHPIDLQGQLNEPIPVVGGRPGHHGGSAAGRGEDPREVVVDDGGLPLAMQRSGY